MDRRRTRAADRLLQGTFELSGRQADVLVDLTAAAARAALSREQAIAAAEALVGRRYAEMHGTQAVRLTAAGLRAAAADPPLNP